MTRRSSMMIRIFTLIVTVLAAAVAGRSHAQSTTWTPIQNVSNDAANSVQPKAAQDPQGNIHFVWREEPGLIKYAKGVWTGKQYSFGASYTLDDTGTFGYATPAIAVAPNGKVMAAWTTQAAGKEPLKVQVWDSAAAQPSGSAVPVSQGREAALIADNNSTFHIVSNGNFLIQYCQWDGASGCSKTDSFGAPNAIGNNQPDIAADVNNTVHVVWMRNGDTVFYRSRANNADWGAMVQLGAGTWPEIASDDLGQVHIVWSSNYDIRYCRKLVNAGCSDQYTVDLGRDVRPSVGAIGRDKVLIAFRDEANRRLAYTVREAGQWSTPATFADGPTDPDVSARSYVSRLSIVWSIGYEVHVITANAASSLTGSLKINGGAPVTNSRQVSVSITNTSTTTAATTYSLADGIEPGTPNLPFTNPSTSTTFTLNASDGQCRVHTVYGKLANQTGQSAAFSGTIKYDGAVDAIVQARNPNLPSNPVLNDFNTLALPTGDIAYTRRQNYNLGVWPAVNECSGLKRYALAKHGAAVDPAAWHDIPAEGYVSRQVNFTPDLPNGGQGTYQYDVYVEDKLGNVSVAPYVLSIVYDVTGPTVAGPGVGLPTTASPKGGVAAINTTGLTVDDNLYQHQASGRKYWGYWVVVKKDSAGAPREDQEKNEWAQYGIVEEGAVPTTLTWNMARGLVGGVQGFTPGTHTVYIRYLDGAGNWSSTITSQSVQVNQLEIFQWLPAVRR